MESVKFEWVLHDKIKNNPHIKIKEAYQKNAIGFIAQSVEKIIPTFVWTDDDGYKSLEYTSMVAIGIGAVQEQQKRIQKIKERINLLKEKISG